MKSIQRETIFYFNTSSLANFSNKDLTPFSPKSISAFSFPLTMVVSITFPMPNMPCLTKAPIGRDEFLTNTFSPSLLLTFTSLFGLAGRLFWLNAGLENELLKRFLSISISSSQSPILACFGMFSTGRSRNCSSMSLIKRLGFEKFVFPFLKRDLA